MSDSSASAGPRRKGFVALGWLPAPAGGPDRLRRAVRRARVAAALGPSLAPHVVEVSLHAEGLAVVWLRGSGWERQLSTLGELLREAVERAVGEPVARVAIRSVEQTVPEPRSPQLPAPGSARERWTSVARQILGRGRRGTF